MMKKIAAVSFLFLALFFVYRASIGQSELLCIRGDVWFWQLPGLKNRAESGDKGSSNRLFDYYSSCGNNEQRDYWMEVSAKNGNVNLQYILGMQKLSSKDTAQEGIQWLNTAAQNKDINANLRLAEIYLSGELIEKDKNRAVQHYLEAASMGSTLGMLRVGDIYTEMEGVCTADARFWFEKALQSSNEKSVYFREAKEKLDSCKSKL